MNHEKEIVMRVATEIENLVRAKVPLHDAPDVVQAVLQSCIQAGYLSRPDLTIPRPALVRTITQRRIADHYRNRGLPTVGLTDGFELPEPEPYDTPERRDQYRQLRDKVAKLGEPYQHVIESRYFHGCSDREIAHETRMPLETVRTRRKRAVRILRKQLDLEM